MQVQALSGEQQVRNGSPRSQHREHRLVVILPDAERTTFRTGDITLIGQRSAGKNPFHRSSQLRQTMFHQTDAFFRLFLFEGHIVFSSTTDRKVYPLLHFCPTHRREQVDIHRRRRIGFRNRVVHQNTFGLYRLDIPQIGIGTMHVNVPVHVRQQSRFQTDIGCCGCRLVLCSAPLG